MSIVDFYEKSLKKRGRNKDDIKDLTNKLKELINNQNKYKKSDWEYGFYERKINELVYPNPTLEYE